MKKGLFMIIAAMFCCMNFSYAQGNDEESIRKILEKERETYDKRDSAGWFALFRHDPNTSFTYAGSGFYAKYSWKQVHANVIAMLNRPGSNKNWSTTHYSDYKIVSSGNIATADFLGRVVDSANVPIRQTLESWSFVKDNDTWKVSKVLSIDTASLNVFTPLDDVRLEAELNTAGYRLMAVKKFDHAIRLFKMNVELFPKAWNTYDSLGEAYAAAGNKKDAITNYEKSIQLNPDNTNGKAILAKLKKAK